jgi:hypothetical protein
VRPSGRNLHSQESESKTQHSHEKQSDTETSKIGPAPTTPERTEAGGLGEVDFDSDASLPGSLNFEEAGSQGQQLLPNDPKLERLNSSISIENLAEGQHGVKGLFRVPTTRHFSAEEERINRLNIRKSVLRKKCWRTPVLDPRKPKFAIWDALITIVVLYTALIVPYEVRWREPSLSFCLLAQLCFQAKSSAP